MEAVKDYLTWIKDNTTTSPVEGGFTEITLPFLDRHNDFSQIYLKTKGNDVYLTDMAYVVSDLAMSGMDISKSSKRQEIFHLSLNRFGLEYNPETEEIFIKTNKASLAEAQHRLIQGMLEVQDMLVLPRSE